ncbi:MAG: hypothetical protein AABX70_00055 [Nanoarchaeota archaeon]
MVKPLDPDYNPSDEDILGVYTSPTEASRPFDVNDLTLTQSQLTEIAAEAAGLIFPDYEAGIDGVKARSVIPMLASANKKSSHEIERIVQSVVAKGVRKQVDVVEDAAAGLLKALKECEEGLAPGSTTNSAYIISKPLSTQPGGVTQILYTTTHELGVGLSVYAVLQIQQGGGGVLERGVLKIQHPSGQMSKKAERAVGLSNTVASAWAGLTGLLRSDASIATKVRETEKRGVRVRAAASAYAQAELRDHDMAVVKSKFEAIVYGLLPGEPDERAVTLPDLFLLATSCEGMYKSPSFTVTEQQRAMCFVRYKAVRNLASKVAEQLEGALRPTGSDEI